MMLSLHLQFETEKDPDSQKAKKKTLKHPQQVLLSTAQRVLAEKKLMRSFLHQGRVASVMTNKHSQSQRIPLLHKSKQRKLYNAKTREQKKEQRRDTH